MSGENKRPLVEETRPDHGPWCFGTEVGTETPQTEPRPCPVFGLPRPRSRRDPSQVSDPCDLKRTSTPPVSLTHTSRPDLRLRRSRLNRDPVRTSELEVHGRTSDSGTPGRVVTQNDPTRTTTLDSVSHHE